MYCDLLNGLLSPDVMKRLRRARLVALPKNNNAVRPVAVGEVFLKLAGLILLLRHEHAFEKFFLPMQHGVMSKAGCETIIHEINRRYLEGNAILTVDLKNAFNCPPRDEIAKSLLAFHTLRPFQRFFAAEYGTPSELLFFGQNGELFGTVKSSSGVRQGSSLSTLYFCTMLQPILESLAQEFPTLRIYAYVDDISLASSDTNLLQQAYLRLNDLLTQKKISMAPEKCIWFGGLHKLVMPERLTTEGLRTENEAIKLLGAFVGETNKVSSLLLEKLKKHEAIFRRLKAMGANNISLLLLARCVNVRHRYHIRVHRPQECFELTKQFDQQVDDVLNTWFGPLDIHQKALARLPVKEGGLGLTPSVILRKSAYEASQHAALERLNKFSVRAVAPMPPQPIGDMEGKSRTPTDEFSTEAMLSTRNPRRTPKK